MPRGKKLNRTEIDMILRLRDRGPNISQIASIVNRSRKVIRNLLKDPENYSRKISGDRPKAISNRERRALLRCASNSMATARQIAQQVGCKAHVRTVRRLLQQAPHIQRRKVLAKPPLTDRHKQARLQFAVTHIHWRKRWRRVIFSDEKRFNLDGPDGFRYYYHDLRKAEQYLMSRQMGGGGIMVWAGIGYYGKTDIAFISTKMNSPRYITLLHEQLTGHAHRIAGNNYQFQQDNAAVHSTLCVKSYFRNQGIHCIDWPARSPDLNIIENC